MKTESIENLCLSRLRARHFGQASIRHALAQTAGVKTGKARSLEASVKHYIARFYSAIDGQFLIESGEIIGGVLLNPVTDPVVEDFWLPIARERGYADALELGGLFVRDDHRGEAHGERLAGTLIAALREQRDFLVFSICREDNDAARRVHEALGADLHEVTGFGGDRWCCWTLN